MAAEIEAALRRAGFERPAFDTIVAGGPNAALPHARASQRQIEPGDLVVLDFGGVLDGYCTDLTRTVIAGRASPQAQRLIEQVIEAQAAAFGAVRPGAEPEAVDEAARDVAGPGGVGGRVHARDRPRAGPRDSRGAPGLEASRRSHGTAA